MYLYRNLDNAGTTAINRGQATVTFLGNKAVAAGSVTAAIDWFQKGTGQNVADNPIQPGQTRNIRIDVQHIPLGWNHPLPSITVDNVTAQRTR